MSTHAEDLDQLLNLFDIGVQHVDELLTRAIAYQKAGQISEAESLYLQILEQQPNQIDTLQNLGAIACQQQQFERGITLLNQAIEIAPDDNVGIHTNLALAYSATGNLDAAIAHYQKVIELQPDCTPAYLSLALALIDQQQLETARDCLERLIARKPDCADAYWNLCAILRQTDNYALWRQTAEQYMQFCHDSDPTGAAISSIQAYYKTGMHAEALRKLEALESQIYRDAEVLSDINIGRIYFLILFAVFRLRDDLEANSKLAKLIGQLYAKSARKTIDAIPHRSLGFDSDLHQFNALDPQRDRLRIGFMSVNFRRHPVGWCIADTIRAMSQLTPHIYLYATSEFKQDDRTEIFEKIAYKCNWTQANWQQQKSETFKNLSHLIDEIEQDNLDVLIDLDSLTASRHPEILLRKPAQLCLSWLGFDAPFLSPENYNLGDRHTHPPGIEPYYLETIIRLPDSHMAVAEFTSVAMDRESKRQEFGVYTQDIAYLCVTPSIKLNYPTVEAHVRILKSVSNSILLYKGRGDIEVVKLLYRQACIDYNLNHDRIKFLPLTVTEEEHRGLYAIADILLDSFPYNGGSHTLEALWFDLPVVTRIGEQSFSRMGCSFLSTLGITDGIARTWDEYVEWGIRFGQDRSLRDAIKQRLIESKHPDRLSPLWNPDKLAKDMYGIFESILGGQRDSDAVIYFELGNSLWHQGNAAEAAWRYRQAIALYPHHAEAWGNLGTVLHGENKLEEAITHYLKSLEINSHNFIVQSNLGRAFKETGRDDAAITCYEQAISIDPHNLNPYNRLGEIFFAREDWQKAWDYFQQAVTLDPNYAFSLSRLGVIHMEWQEPERAATYFERAIACDPEYAYAHVNLSIALLLKGEYPRGFIEYEWRWQTQDFLQQNSNFSQPAWDGSDLQDRTLLIYAEQGLGDFMQFIRYLPLVKAKCGDHSKIVLTSPASILPLLRDNRDLVKDIDLIEMDSPLPKFDICVPLLSLPRILGANVASIPTDIPYLYARHDQVALPSCSASARLRIGIVWATCSANSNVGKRSCPLGVFQKLVSSNSVTFYSLQTEIPSTETDLFDELGDRIVDLRDRIQNFADTAAIIEQMDLIISIDSAVAHLAGAMGKQVWLLLPFASDWRWMLEREDSPWYPTMCLFRQRQVNDWHGIIDRVTTALHNLCHNGEVIQKISPCISSKTSLQDMQLDPDAMLKIGIDRLNAGEFVEAAKIYQQILQVQPDNFNALYLAGVTAFHLDRLAEAIGYLQQAISLKSDHAEAYKKLADIYEKQGNRDDAIATYHKAISLKPNQASFYMSLGIAYFNSQQFNLALEQFQTAITLEPLSSNTYNWIGMTVLELGRLEDAVTAFRSSISYQPEYVDAHVNLGIVLLKLGNLAEGLTEYEWRSQRSELTKDLPESFSQPLWDGKWDETDPPQRGVLIFSEQGYGDVIQFIRFLPLVKNRVGKNCKLIFDCDPALYRLIHDFASNLGIQIVQRGNALPLFDLRIALMSLPKIFGTTLETIPNRTPYLSVPPAITPSSLVEISERALFKVGLAWSCNLANSSARKRSCPFPLLTKLFYIPGVHFYTLQKELTSADREILDQHDDRITNLSDRLGDFADTAEIVEQMDLVISVDTSVAHLAGALGKPVWVLLPFASDWRWLQDREVSPWYPTMRLFRQTQDREWQDVIDKMFDALQKLCSGDEMSQPILLNPDKQHPDLDSHAMLQAAIAHQQAGGLDEAAQIYHQILQQQPGDFNALYLSGVVAFRQNRLNEAIDYLQRTIALKNDHAEAHRKLGDIFKQQRKPEDAIASYQQAISYKPDYYEAHYFLGVVFWNQDNFTQAIFHYQRAIEIKPDYAEAHGNLGAVLFKEGKVDEAIECYHRALAINSQDTIALCNLAVALVEQGKIDEAIKYCQAAIQVQPDSENAYCNLAYVYQSQGSIEKAIAAYQKVLDLNPNHIDAHIGMGNMYSNLQQYESAIDEFNRAIALDLTNSNAYNWLGFVSLEVNQVDTAINAFRHSISCNSSYPEAHLNLSLALLLQGNYAEGLAEYEWRSQRSGLDKSSPHFFPHPIWDGKDLQGRTLLIYCEQGFGDLIQFIRYIPIVRTRCGSNSKIIFDCQEPVRRLFEPFVSNTDIEIRPRDLPLPHFDIKASLLSLPHILGTTLDTITASAKYLAVGNDINPDVVSRIGDCQALLKVGLVWASKQTHSTAPKRSCHLPSLLPLFDLANELSNGQTNIHFYVLQKDISDADRQLVEQYQAKLTDLSNYLGDFADTAAIIDRLDLVITVDTSVAHLAGAMGKPTWVMLPFAPDWRWMLEREDSPWYPTMRLFRQDRAGNWQGVIDRVDIALRELSDGIAANFDRRDRQSLRSAKSPKPSKAPKPSKSPKKSNKHGTKSSQVESPQSDIDALLQEAIAHHNSGRLTEAETIYRRILQLQPYHFSSLHMMGVLSVQAKKLETGISWLEKALTSEPDNSEAHSNLGNVLSEVGKYDDAISHYERAIALNPKLTDAYYNLGLVNSLQGNLDQAISYYQRTIDICPTYAQAHNNLGTLLQKQGQFERAKYFYQQAIAINPNHAEAKYNLSMLLLLLGNLGEGFIEYEWRWSSPTFLHDNPSPSFPQPLWDGSNLGNRTLLISSEQGYGDNIQFSRYLASIKVITKKIIFICPPSLEKLFGQFEGIKLVRPHTPLPDFDVHISLLSLPRVFGTDVETIPAQIPYLSAPSTIKTGDSLKNPDHFSIGIVWASKASHPTAGDRTCPLDILKSLFDIPNISFYCLQKEIDNADRLLLEQYHENVTVLSDRLQDFADTAAIIAQLDLVISVDTAVAHLAGAMGKPTWVLLPFSPDWRWMLEREDSPWYPTMRLFRQERIGDWTPLIDRVGNALRDYLTNTGSPNSKMLTNRAIAAPVEIASESILLDTLNLDILIKEAIALQSDGKLVAAEQIYHQVLHQQPNNFNALYLLGIAVSGQERSTEAIAYFQKTISLKPDHAEAHKRLGDVLVNQGKAEEALLYYQKACRIKPDYVAACHQCANILTNMARTEEAIDYYQQVLRYEPKHAISNRMKLLLLPAIYDSSDEIKDWRQRFAKGLQEFIRQSSAVIEVETERVQILKALSNDTNFYLAYQGQNDLTLQCQYGNLLHQAIAAQYPQWTKKILSMPALSPGNKIRVGYISAYLHNHAATKWLMGWLKYCDRDKFEIFCYYTGEKPDFYTEQFQRESDRFYHLNVGNEAICEQIYSDQLHILVFVDIGMYPPTSLIAASRLAPVQCAGWGHPVTTGIPTIDYYLSSELMEPANGQSHYSEELVRLPQLGVSYLKPTLPTIRKSRADFGISEGAVVYLCSQALFKYLPQYDYIFGRIARAIPQSQFVFFHNDSDNTTITERFRQRLSRTFVEHGLTIEQFCIFIPRMEFDSYLNLNLVSDVFLDTIDFSGGNTTLEAIACGLSIVTLPGEFMRGRHSYAMLKVLGVEDTIANSEEEYIEIAVKLGKDANWRQDIVKRMSDHHHILYNDLNCVRALEEFYQSVVSVPNIDDILAEAVAYHKAGRLPDADKLYRKVLQHQPHHFGALHMLGTLASQLGQIEIGIAHIQQALALNPQSAEAHSNLGSAYNQRGNLVEAISHYRSAISLKPDYADAHKNLGLALLASGNLKDGFREYEWRWQSDGFKADNPLPDFPHPLWDGTDASDHTLLIYSEQGLGDALQFCRYIPLIAARVDKIILDCRQPLRRLLNHTFSSLDNLQIAQRGDPLPQFDLRISLMSLAHIWETTLDTIPTKIPYLLVPPSTSAIKTEISQHKAQLKVGLVWASKPGHSTTSARSCPLEVFLQLLDIPEIKFYSLQKEVSDRDEEILKQHPDKLMDLRHYLGDFADTAAIIELLDLVISVDTSVAHLAGALGKSVWVLLPHVADWRWLQGRDDSPWYPNMRLFRQSRDGEWVTVMTRVGKELNIAIAQSQNHSCNFKSGNSSSEMIKQNIGLNVTIGSPTGWGVVGTNLLLEILKSSHFSPYLIAPPDFSTGYINPLHQHLLASIISEQKRLHHVVASNPNKQIYVDLPIIHVLDNSKPNYNHLQVRGKQNYGYAVFESSHLSAEKIDSFSRFDLILVASTWNANILRNYGLTNVRLAIQGIDPTIFHPAPRSNLFGDRFVIFSGGKLEFRKAQDIVVAAFKIFQSRHPDALLITAWHNFWPVFMAGIERTGNVVGLPALDSNHRLKIAEWLTANGLPPGSFIDLGLVPNHITPQIVREADVALFPNRCEAGTNLVAMECLASGIPTILSTNTGHLDLLGDPKDIGFSTVRHCYPLRHQTTVMQHPHFSGVEGWGESDVEETVEILEQAYTDRTEAKLRGERGALFMQGMTWEKQVEKILAAIATQISV
jgi:predicted O-linked N-acetylglucosamine transferase (SPINDLY family)/ADP-heptose:LPS heptosyltransferase/glycosyltransferase involved in cell wall biosynthesis